MENSYHSCHKKRISPTKLVLTSILLLFWFSVDAQIVLILDTIIVNKVNPPKSTYWEEGMYEGPYLQLTCIIENNTDSTIQISPSQARIILKFRYNGEQFSNRDFTVPLQEIPSIALKPKEKTKFDFGQSIFLGTTILKINEEKLDYTLELLQVLPTVTVIYKDKGLTLKSTEILNVKVKNN